MHVSGSLYLSNRSANDTSFLQIENATINFTISNSSGLQAQHLLNTSAAGVFRSKSELFSGTQINASPAEGYYNFTARYRDPDNVEWRTGGVMRVFGQSIDIISISPAKARYSAGENVSIKLSALREIGDKSVALANVSVNGSVRYTNRTIITSFSCITETNGACTVSLTAPSAAATYILESNNFLSTSSFRVIPFEAFLYLKDSTGENFKEIFNTNEVGTVEVRVTENGSTATGDFVFNGTITSSNSSLITRVNSTNLNSNNSYTNRFTFTVSNSFANGLYFVDITAYKTGGGSASSTTSFQVRSWSLSFAKSSENSGFEYEYAAFANKNISFEIFPKERENGTIITGLNNTQFNITLKGKTGDTIATGNSTWNDTCSSTGCYTFKFATPSAAGRYVLAVSLNYSNELQTINRIISVTSTSLSATPTNQEGELKEQFGTTEFVYVTLSAENSTSALNVTDVILESVIYENGTLFDFTQVAWDKVNSSNSALEWAFNSTIQRIKFDAPKTGGNYLVNIFASNRTAAASTKFSINPYSVCGVAKSTAGSVDSSSSFYVWQYKSTDTVYLELKITQAQNAAGKTTSNNSVFSSTYYGMGNACYVDTTKTQVITNATITIESVVNLQTNAKAALNTTASTCSADDNQGTYTCTVKPSTRWDGGRHIVNLKIRGQDSETTDNADSMFEARAFYIWAYTNSWTNKPASNITFNIQMYEAGTNWWSNLGSQGGINGEVSIEKVEYNGKDGEWLWPPIDAKYNTTGLNTSNVTSGKGTLTLSTSRLPKGKWEPGYYALTIKGTNGATGESDYGQAWFGIKQWDAYSTPVELSGTSYNYKNSFGIKENVTLFIRITNAGDYNDNGGVSLGGNISIGVKKLQYYTSWPPTELNSSAYGVTKLNVNASSPWHYNANSNSHSGYVMTIYPTNGIWPSGYYNIILDINGSETGYGWFNAVSFYVSTQPSNENGTYTYTKKGSGPVYFNVSTIKNQKLYSTSYSSADYINTTIKDIVLRTWLEDTWQSVEFNYPEDLNVSPLKVNGTALITVNKTGSWPSGYYWGEITMLDAENSTGTGYLWFSVRPFRVETSVNQYTIDATSNVSVTLNIRNPDWSSNSNIPGNYTVIEIYEEKWTSGGRSKTSFTNYVPSASQTFNATTVLNISPSTTWSSDNNGYHYLNIIVKDNSDNSSQKGWASFRSVPFSVSLGSIGNQYSISQTSNITFPVSVTKALTGENTTANVSRAYEWAWPTQTEYSFAVGNCSSSSGTICQINGTQNITLIAPSGGWPSGWHYIYLQFLSTDGSNKVEADSQAWFNAVQAYDGYFSNYDENNNWKYYFGFEENITIRIYVRNSNYIPQIVNITKVEMSEDGDNCWSESCKSYTNYSYTINGSGGTGISGNGTIKITNHGLWKRGQHSIKATISGNAGTAVIKTGYVWVKDNTKPNITIIIPQTGATINQSSFLLSATSSEDVKCSLELKNFDQFYQHYCTGSSNSTNESSCNSTRFNGSNSYSRYVHYPPYGDVSTGGTSHSYTFSTIGLAIQDYGLKLNCYDLDWNYATAQAAFKINFSSSPITVNLSSPANNSVLNTTTITFHYTVTGTPNGILSCLAYVNLSGGWNGYVPSGANLNSTGAATSNITLLDYFTNGTYKWTIYCADSENTAWAAKNWTFTVNNDSTTSNATSNVTGIIITLTAPADNASFTTQNSSINITFTINASATVTNGTCDLYTNYTGNWTSNKSATLQAAGSQGNNLSINITTNGTFKWNVKCGNSTLSNFSSANRTFSVIVNNGSTSSSANTTAVTVNLSNPVNTSVVNARDVTFRYNITGTSGGTVNCSLYLNQSSGWSANASKNTALSSTSASDNISVSNFVNSTYLWNVYCFETTNTSNNAWAAANWTFTINNITTSDTTSNSSNGFTISLSSPSNASTLNTSVSFVYNASDPAGSLFNCTLWGNFTGAWAANLTNNSVSGLVTTETMSLSISDYLWNVRCVNSTNSGIYNWSKNGNWTFTKSG